MRKLPVMPMAAFEPQGVTMRRFSQYYRDVSVCPVNQVAIQFINHSSNAARYLWDFGDGMMIQGERHASPCFSMTSVNAASAIAAPFTCNVTRCTPG